MKGTIELVCTGTELLSGRTVNTHVAATGKALATLGLALARECSVPDDWAAIADAVSAAVSRADVVLVSGGLGPTEDDVTRDVVAHLLKRAVVTDQAALDALRVRLRAMGRPCNLSVERQALVVEGADVLPNPVGFAPGERLDINGKTIFLLPGPPEEFRAVLEAHVIPWLRQRFSDRPPVFSRVFMVCGLGESAIMERFRNAQFPPDGIELAYCASPGRVELRLVAFRQDLLDDAAARARKILGTYIFSEDASSMEVVVGQLLRRHQATLAVAESCTGGLLGGRITQPPGSSDYFAGGVICYSNSAKAALLGISDDMLKREGAVSASVAKIMAESVRRLFGTTYGLAVTGIAGPTGGTAEKPIGLVFLAVADESGTSCRSFRFGGGRDRIREWSVQMALDLLRRRILGMEEDE